MTRKRVISAAAILAAAASVWFAVVFASAGRVRAGVGGKETVRVASVARAQRARAAVQYVGALVLIGVLTGAGLVGAGKRD